jgi:alpha-1,3-rhamnosyl/mannosyltransferase
MGMGHYDRLLVRSVSKNNTDSRWAFDIVFAGRSTEQKLDPKLIDPGLENASFIGFSPTRLYRLPWPLTQQAITMADRGEKPDIYHSLSLGFPCPQGKPAVYTIHDLPPTRFPDEGDIPSWGGQAARLSKAIIVPSEFAKNEIVEHLNVSPERVRVIQYGCEHDVFHPGVEPASTATLRSYGLNGPFLFYAGGFTRRKNVRELLRAWSEIAPKYAGVQLALAGPTDQLKALVAEMNPPQTVVLGYLPHETLRAILKAAQALVCPSIYEGFGLPPLEAMALGVPVIGVCAGAVPEVVGDAAILAEDGSAEALSGAMEMFFSDSALAERLREQGPERAKLYSWDRYAEQVFSIYREVTQA